MQDVNKLLKQYDQMNDMMKKISSKAGLMKLMRSMGGKMPPGMMPKAVIPLRAAAGRRRSSGPGCCEAMTRVFL